MKANLNTSTTIRSDRTMSSPIRYLTVTAMLSAIAFILMYLEISIPVVPSFLKFDFSELPALIGAFAFGPLCGVLIELVKNTLHLAFSNSMFVGELSNFILGSIFVLIAGSIYRLKKNKISALAGGIAGSVVMGLFSVISNYFLVYPAYYAAGMQEETILSMYQAILKSVNSIWQCLWVFNVPFTIVKGLIATAFCMLIYKPLSKILKGYRK